MKRNRPQVGKSGFLPARPSSSHRRAVPSQTRCWGFLRVAAVCLPSPPRVHFLWTILWNHPACCWHFLDPSGAPPPMWEEPVEASLVWRLRPVSGCGNDRTEARVQLEHTDCYINHANNGKTLHRGCQSYQLPEAWFLHGFPRTPKIPISTGHLCLHKLT